MDLTSGRSNEPISCRLQSTQALHSGAKFQRYTRNGAAHQRLETCEACDAWEACEAWDACCATTVPSACSVVTNPSSASPVETKVFGRWPLCTAAASELTAASADSGLASTATVALPASAPKALASGRMTTDLCFMTSLPFYV